MPTEEQPAAAAALPLPAPAVQFYIPATSSLQERRPRTLKHGATFGVFDHYGDMVPGEGSPEGLYHDDTRFLAGLQLLINERRPLLLSSTVQDNNALLSVDLTTPDFFDEAGRLYLPRDTIHIVRAKYIWQQRAYERLAVRNFDGSRHTIRLTLLFCTDFADLFEVRGQSRPARGEITRAALGPAAVAFTYHGLAGDTRQTVLHFAPQPTCLEPDRTEFDLVLEPFQRTSLFVAIGCDVDQPVRPQAERFFICLREARRALRTSSARASSVATSNEIFN